MCQIKIGSVVNKISKSVNMLNLGVIILYCILYEVFDRIKNYRLFNYDYCSLFTKREKSRIVNGLS